MRCTNCGGTLANVQGYRQCQECGHVNEESPGTATHTKTRSSR